MNQNQLDPRTFIAQAGHKIDAETGAVVPPMHTSATFARDANYDLIGPDLYSRYSSPTVRDAEDLINTLEGGAGARLFGSGLAAIAAIFERVKPGQHIAAPRVMYFGAQAWLKRIAKERGIGLTLYDQTKLKSLSNAVIRNKTAIVWIETPSNPTWDVVDIEAAAKIAHDAGALLGVDGTCAPPCTTKALSHGADIVFHSATKYLNGHSDITAGVVVTATTEHLGEIDLVRTLSGGVLGGFEAWLLVRGMRTLFLRFDWSSANALAFARHFRGHAGIEAVLYPGLKDHPGHDVAKRQMTGGFGGMLSVIVKGSEEEVRRKAGSFRVFVPATSLGGVESLVEHRISVEGPDSPTHPGLLRFSIGIEAVDDLIADFERVLAG